MTGSEVLADHRNLTVPDIWQIASGQGRAQEQDEYLDECGPDALLRALARHDLCVVYTGAGTISLYQPPSPGYTQINRIQDNTCGGQEQPPVSLRVERDTAASTATTGWAEADSLLGLLDRVAGVLSVGRVEDLEPGERGPFWRALDRFFDSSGGRGLEALAAKADSPHLDDDVVSYFLEWLSLMRDDLTYRTRCDILRRFIENESATVRLSAASGLEWLECREAQGAILAAAEAEQVPLVRETLLAIAEGLGGSVR